MNKIFYALFTLVFAGLLTGCGNVVDEGKIAIQKNIVTGQYKDGYKDSGWHIDPFYTYLDIDAREMVIPVTTDPKDSEGVALPTVKVEMRVRIKDKNQVVPAMRDNLRIEADDMLGMSRLISDATVSVRQVSEKLKAEEMFSNNAEYSRKLIEKYQENLNKLYPNLFIVTQANVLKVDVPEFIQTKISSVAIKAAEIERNNATLSSLASRENLQKKEAELIHKFMENSKLNADQFVEMEKIKMIREIYEDGSSASKNSSQGGLPTLIVNMSK